VAKGNQAETYSRKYALSNHSQPVADAATQEKIVCPAQNGVEQMVEISVTYVGGPAVTERQARG
jgi:hypothetical protein